MADKNLTRDLRARKPKKARGCSDLYRYILDNWTELWRSGFGQDGGPSWQELTDRLTSHGRVNARGGALQRLRVREVFRRVQAEVMAKDVQRRTGMAVKPVRKVPPQGWTPPVVERSKPAQISSSPFAPSQPTAEDAASDDISPEELMAGIRDVIAKRSGR